MDLINWMLLGAAVGAVAWWYLRSKGRPVKVGSTIHVETRQQAKPLIPPASAEAPGDWFVLQESPMGIKPTEKLTADGSWFDAPIPEALWVAQRAMLLRLEGELMSAQQADLSEHFAIAASPNQPAELLARTLTQAEAALKHAVGALKIPAPLKLWYGRALIVMLSTRNLFDHVAWLTGAEASRSTTGSLVQLRECVALLPIYATRMSDTRRIIYQQVSRLVLRAVGVGRHYPRWLEEGLTLWLEQKGLGQPVAATKASGDEAVAILDERAWEQAESDPAELERLRAISGRVVQWLMRQQESKLLRYLHMGPAEEVWPAAMGFSEEDCVRGAATSQA